ncbi:MAG: Crp/Fnr family transcriptional regulator [Sedimentitalea sp.]
MADTTQSGWTGELLARVTARAARVAVPDGTCLFSPGSSAETFLIVLSGAVRLEQTSATGRSVVLYRVMPGESCVMTTSCLLSGTPHGSFGYAEGAVEALSLGQNAFRAMLADDPPFMAAVFSVFSERMVELTQVIDELLLHRVDQKLATWLADHAEPSVQTTHQALAQELGTAREVVSRTLKDFERRGWLALSRGTIAVLARADLAHFGKPQ